VVELKTEVTAHAVSCQYPAFPHSGKELENSTQMGFFSFT